MFLSVAFQTERRTNMNKITILAAVTSLSVAAMPLYADDAHHPEKAQQAAPAPKAGAPAAAMAKSAKPVAAPQVERTQETMRKLQDQMGKIRQASDPAERRKLLHEHMQTMQEGMKQMRAMGGMMMGMGNDGKQGGMMMGGGMMQMHDMMEMRMEMMGMMMEQMMQREEMRDAMPGK
jgi:hypothetical protein